MKEVINRSYAFLFSLRKDEMLLFLNDDNSSSFSLLDLPRQIDHNNSSLQLATIIHHQLTELILFHLSYYRAMSLSGCDGYGTKFKMQDYSFWLTSPRYITSYKFPCIQYPFEQLNTNSMEHHIYSHHYILDTVSYIFPSCMHLKNIYITHRNFSTTCTLFQLPTWEG